MTTQMQDRPAPPHLELTLRSASAELVGQPLVVAVDHLGSSQLGRLVALASVSRLKSQHEQRDHGAEDQ
jgi:hypothetical protein